MNSETLFWLSIGFSAFFGIFIGVLFALDRDALNPIASFLGGLFWGGLAMMVVIMVITSIIGNIQKDDYTFHVPIRSVGATTNTEGSFFLGSGSVDEEAVFYYYRIDGNEITLKYRYADHTKIVEDENDSPYMECFGHKMPSWYTNNEPKFDQYANCVFHVPADSVIKTFALTPPTN